MTIKSVTTKQLLKATLLAVLVLAMPALAGCSSRGGDESNMPDGEEPGTEVARYTNLEAGEIPRLMAHDDDTWYMLLSPYSTYNYKLSISNDPATLNVVYEGTMDGSLWNLAAEDGYAAWVETTEAESKVMLYDPTKKTATAVKSYNMDTDDQDQLLHALNKRVYMEDGILYYCVVDTVGGTLDVGAIDVATGEENLAYSQPYDAQYYGGCFSVSDGKILVSANAFKGEGVEDRIELVTIDTEDGSVSSYAAPAGVNRIYDAEVEDDLFAIYYYDNRKDGDETWNGCDNIGTFKAGDEETKALFTFPKDSTNYAYHDDIHLQDGWLAWVYQIETSGEIVDHYYVDFYNLETDEPHVIKAGFDLLIEDDGIYSLVWDEENSISDVHLYQKPLEYGGVE